MREIWVATLFAAHAEEEENAILLVDPQQLRDVPITLGDLVFQLAVVRIVEIQVAPVVAFAEPDELLRIGEIAPVDSAVSALKESGDGFLQDVAHLSRGGAGDAEDFFAM